MAHEINISRLLKNLETLSRFGRTDHGITRPSFSPADIAARKWLLQEMTSAGIAARMDAAGNIFGRIGPEGPAVVAGSHLDTVPNGGMFDGALGVMAALECVRTIRENEIPVRWPIEVAAFSDEEGAFVSFLGSRAVTGALKTDELADTATNRPTSLREAMNAAGLSLEAVHNAHRAPEEIIAYLELHIEQGPQLEARKINIGLVEAIRGIATFKLIFSGEAVHAGTAPVRLRKDALVGAAALICQLSEYCYSLTGGVATAGEVIVSPGASNVVPSRAEVVLDIRFSSQQVYEGMVADIKRMGREIAARKGLGFEIRRTSFDPPANAAPRILDLLADTAKEMGYPYMIMDSGAAHDAQIMSTITEMGMIFIPSIGGKSHCPEEKTHWADVKTGADLLLAGLILLANE